MDDDGVGFRFFLRLAGLVLLAGIVAMIFFLIFSRAVYAFGFLGGFLLFAGLLILGGYIYDRRAAREYAEEP